VCFSKAEYKAVSRAAEKLGVSLIKRYLRGEPKYIPRQIVRQCEMSPAAIKEQVAAEKLECPFLGKDGEGKSLCRIYELRPRICRLFGSRPDIDPRMKCQNQKEDEKDGV
jgi:Fe-S-cluster containining protein